MVKTQKLPMQEIARRLADDFMLTLRVAGVEAVMASLGVITTPGTKVPIAGFGYGRQAPPTRQCCSRMEG